MVVTSEVPPDLVVVISEVPSVTVEVARAVVVAMVVEG